MVTTVYIYGLMSPFTNEVFYVGKSYQPEQRYKQHIRMHDGSRSEAVQRKQAWIREIQDRGEQPQLVIFATVTEDDEELDRHVEHDWTVKLLEAGHPLVNDSELSYKNMSSRVKVLGDALERGRRMFDADV